MESGVLENAMPRNQGGFLRQKLHSDRLEGILKVPEELKHRMLEVILLPAEDDFVCCHASDTKAFLEKVQGTWAGEPLVREDQGTYETREELE